MPWSDNAMPWPMSTIQYMLVLQITMRQTLRKKSYIRAYNTIHVAPLTTENVAFTKALIYTTNGKITETFQGTMKCHVWTKCDFC